MLSYIQKWGNSLGLRIPAQAVKCLNLHPGSAVQIEIENGRLIIQPAKYTLQSMLAEITPENMHHPVFDNDLRGNEEW